MKAFQITGNLHEFAGSAPNKQSCTRMIQIKEGETRDGRQPKSTNKHQTAAILVDENW